MSKQDSLTGLLNRGTSVRAIRHILKNSQDHHILIMLDIDRFKQINDRYGHQFGDKALRTAAVRLKSALRRDDVFGRLGGDEFIILLKDVSYSMDLYARLENLCSLIGSAWSRKHIYPEASAQRPSPRMGLPLKHSMRRPISLCTMPSCTDATSMPCTNRV